ncbi:MAG: OmpA family protein [Proteobacteria bacterium]|nr:OmpA family protein [Pseudomonadota bacterium]
MANKFRLTHLFLITSIMSVLFFMTPSSMAQEVDTSFSVQLFRPSPGPQNFFAVESPEIGDDMTPYVGLMLSYQHRSFGLLECSGSNNCEDSDNTIDAVKYFLSADILGSFNFLKRFQVGLVLPFTLYQEGEETILIEDPGDPTKFIGAQAGDTYKAFHMGDLRIHLKGRILGKEGQNGPFLSAALIVSLPIANWIGNDQSDDAEGAYGYGGEGFMTFEAPKIMFGWRFFNALRFTVDVGALWRQKSTMVSVELGNALTYSGAIGYLVIPKIEVMAEIYGMKSFVSENFSDMESAPLLFLGGARFLLQDFLVHLGFGGGILKGPGVPQFQVVLGGAWAPSKKKEEQAAANAWDVDSDGIENEADKCRHDPEDLDGFEDDDGCPDFDNDKDGVVDGYDSCPMEPEDKDGFRDEDGCPDLDHDEDGVKEPDDKCPDNAEDFDDFEDADGCPEADNDKDGLLDTADFCPDEPEDKDGFQDDDGCPDLDNDGDGVADAKDKCPNKPETLNGFKDGDGCPDKGKALVIVTEEKIELKEMIQFKTGSDVIKGKKSFKILNIVAGILIGNSVLRVSIEGHTDSSGRAAKNRKLSKERAEAVKKYLMEQKIAESRLETVGWGPDKPIESNKTKRGRTANRRVEFVIIQKTKKVIQPVDEEGESEMDFSSEPEDEDDAEMDFTAE